jgi:hypothetical protein
MAKTPFIRPLSAQGGTFFTFSSAAEDLSLTFNNSLKKFKFSKFVLLKIPDFAAPIYGENSIRFNAIDSTFLDSASGTYNLTNPSNSSPSLEISFQNYCLNFESTILSDPNYDPDLKKTISEKVFWKWMKEIGAVRFRPASQNEVVPSLDQLNTTIVGGFPYSDKRWTEEDDNLTGNGIPSPRYNRVVKYIGECDIVNSVQNNINSYSEVYIHVPTNDGGTPYSLFRTSSDINYYPGKTWKHSPADPLDVEYLQGRSNTIGLYGPNGLPTLAIFDQDVLGEPGVSGTDSNGNPITSNWYQPRDEANSYFSEDSFFDGSTDSLTKYLNASGPSGPSVSYKRSRLDGIELDFDATSYKQIQNYVGISSIEEWNGTPITKSFDFNAVLIYYDVYDPNNIQDSATNLYGILFLGPAESTSINAARIPSFKKYKPDPITKLNGNSYGLKINLKFDTNVESTGVEQAINDYSSFSLSMFMDSATVLQEASRTLNDRTLEIIDIKERLNVIEELVINQDDNTEIRSRLEKVENALQTNQALFDNTQDIMSMIEKNADDIGSIFNNETSVEISYNLDLLKSGSGTKVDRSVPNRLAIDVSSQTYSLDTNFIITINPVSGNTHILQPFTNYIKHKNNGLLITATGDIIIKIDDTINKWKKGQTLRISFGDELDLGNYSLVILTDSSGLYPIQNPVGTAYSTVVTSFNKNNFINSGYKPIFEIICVDDVNLSFEVDQIK